MFSTIVILRLQVIFNVIIQPKDGLKLENDKFYKSQGGVRKAKL